MLLVKSEMKLQMGIKPFQSSVGHCIWMEIEFFEAALTVNICFCKDLWGFCGRSFFFHFPEFKLRFNPHWSFCSSSVSSWHWRSSIMMDLHMSLTGPTHLHPHVRRAVNGAWNWGCGCEHGPREHHRFPSQFSSPFRALTTSFTQWYKTFFTWGGRRSRKPFKMADKLHNWFSVTQELLF